MVYLYSVDIISFFQENSRYDTIHAKPTRFLIVASESIGDLLYLSSLLESFKECYKDYDIYLATKPEYHSIFDGNNNVHKMIDYIQLDFVSFFS